ncbi:uracil-DNA glycosylase-like protein [Fennellomyces sp. T-0311]|nr:uracil-DNA glycosylase-like protein [Fennellomyces sp. T-0311]
MQAGNKRPLDESVEMSNKKKPTATRQLSLLSMFQVKTENKDTAKTVESLELAAPVTRDPRDLFPDISLEMSTLLDLELTTMHYDWLKVLKAEVTKPYFIALKKFIKGEMAEKKTIYPPGKQIYSWSNLTPPSQVKVVIIGQDPYHGVNQAHGLCFSVVKGVAIPPSLTNIYKALQKDYPDFKVPKHGFLEKWAQQGVLLLNTSLTVRAAAPGSHSNKGWENLTDAVINHINEKKAHVVFMLWGSHAHSKGSKINKSKHLVLKSVHPSPLSAYRGFFDCGHFKKANEYLLQNARDPIDWNCLTDD